jgi:hypothetical protein
MYKRSNSPYRLSRSYWDMSGALGSFIPRLQFTNLDLLPWWRRWWRQAQCYFLAAFGFRQPSRYLCHRSSRLAGLDIGYLLIETITSGEMLSESWDEKCNDARLQENLQRDLARIMLSLASVKLPHIGTFRLDPKGYLHLDNRPLSVQSTMQENEGIYPLVSPDTPSFLASTTLSCITWRPWTTGYSTSQTP